MTLESCTFFSAAVFKEVPPLKPDSLISTGEITADSSYTRVRTQVHIKPGPGQTMGVGGTPQVADERLRTYGPATDGMTGALGTSCSEV